MNIPTRICAADTDAEPAVRHLEVIRRLDQLGADQVRMMIGHGLPEVWTPLICGWLKEHER